MDRIKLEFFLHYLILASRAIGRIKPKDAHANKTYATVAPGKQCLRCSLPGFFLLVLAFFVYRYILIDYIVTGSLWPSHVFLAVKENYGNVTSYLLFVSIEG